jgi:hypothetical protein
MMVLGIKKHVISPPKIVTNGLNFGILGALLNNDKLHKFCRLFDGTLGHSLV